MNPASLYSTPNSLAAHYSRFRVADRLLLTGHSHQAWPDVSFAAQAEAWEDAAELVDDKWERAFQKADAVKAGFAKLLGEPGAAIALASNTHELVVRLLSALPLQRRPRIVTTDGEFHTVRRQCDRLGEEGIEIVRVAESPLATVAERVAAAVDDRTALVVLSAVFFDTGRIARGLGAVSRACRRHGATFLLDVYHTLNVVPFSIAEHDLADAYIVGGGYKYCQLGEGNCFLRLPQDCDLRPVITGWFSEFTALSSREREGRTTYGQGGERFAGATYDPASHYRAARVFEFFDEQGLTPAVLREISQHQIAVLADAFDHSAIDPRRIRREQDAPLSETGGFLALTAPRAGEIATALHQAGVLVDARGDKLRFGPAPYLSDRQLTDAILHLTTVAQSIPL